MESKKKMKYLVCTLPHGRPNAEVKSCREAYRLNAVLDIIAEGTLVISLFMK